MPAKNEYIESLCLNNGKHVILKNSIPPYLKPLIIMAISIAITGCGSYRMNVDSGSFQVLAPPTINGYGNELDKNSTSKRITAEYNFADNTTKKISGKKNQYVNTESDRDLPESDANFDYRIIEKIFDAKFERTKKWEYWIAGVGAGFSMFPYAYLNAGINLKYFEIGAASLLGYAYNKASYTGQSSYWGKSSLGLGPDYGDDRVEYNGWQWHSYASEYLYASIVYFRLSVKYSAALSYPMGIFNDLPASKESGEYDLSFQFPYLLKQSVQLSYQTQSNIEFSVGSAQITGKDFSGRDYQYSAGIGKQF